MSNNTTKQPQTFLVARFCAPGSFDIDKIMLHVNDNLPHVGYADLKGAYANLYNHIIHSKWNPSEINSLSPSASSYLDNFDRKNEFLLIDVCIGNLEIFHKFCQLVQNRYQDLKLILLFDNPLEKFNCLGRPAMPTSWSKSSGYYFEHQLYRLDILLNNAEQIFAPQNLFVNAFTDRQSLEKKLFAITGLEYGPELAVMPFPNTFQAHALNSFIGLPTWKDIVLLSDWRNCIANWEKDRGIAPSRLHEPGQFRTLAEQLHRYGSLAKKRYPQLGNILNFNVDDYCERQLYPGITDEDIASFARAIPEDMAKKLVPAFSFLNRGFPPFYQRFFKRLGEFNHLETGADLSIPKCSVISFAFNHEKYIAQCMDSVASQKLNCSMEHIIVDDASTDETPQIIRAYKEKYTHIKTIFFKSKPPNPIGPAFQSCKSQYVAMCDGDDYFINNHKLQKQIDLLDSFGDCSMCFHYAEVFYEDGSPAHIYPPREALPGGVRRFYTIKDLLQVNLMQASSAMYRWRFRDGLPSWFNPYLQPGDWYWHFLHAELGLIAFIPEIMSRYRRHAGSVYESAEKGAVGHRHLHGLKELAMYQHCDEHFKLKYHNGFASLASGVFANFVQHFANTGDSDMLDRAMEFHPAFAKDFFASLKIIEQKR